MVQVLLAAGADVIAEDNNSWTALMWAADCGHPQAVEVRQLMESGVEYEHVMFGNYFCALFVFFCLSSHPRYVLYCYMVKVLLSAGADVNATDIDGRTSLMLAADNGHSHCLEVT